MKKRKREKINEKIWKEMWKRWAEIKSMPTYSLVGEILARAQLIEELMRMYIVKKSKKYNHSHEVKGTFGQLRQKFENIYPNATLLLENLEIANEVRNDIAHSTFLISWFISDRLQKHKNVSNRDVERFNHKALEKQFYLMEDCLFEFQKFVNNNPLENNLSLKNRKKKSFSK